MGRRRLRDVVLYALAAVVLVVSAVVDYFYLGMTLQRIYTPLMPIHADFDTFWRSSNAFLEGRDAYETGAELVNLNPPLWVILVAPFALLEPLAGFRLFAVFTAVLMAASLVWIAAELRPWRANPLVGSFAIVALLVSSPLLATLALGQMYPVLTLGLVAAWALDRRGRPLPSGAALGIVVALKPSLAPVVLWPVVRRRWGASLAAVISGAAATLVGVVLLGPGATVQWLGLLTDEPLSPYWDNASLPAAAARLFTEHEFGQPLANLPWTVPLFGLLGLVLVLLTAYDVARRDPEAGLWALVAASLLASPIAWNNYLLLLAPGVLLLLARSRTAVAVLLVALQLLPPQWPLLWQEGAPLGADVGPVVSVLALTSYFYVLAAHWLAFVTHGEASEARGAPKPKNAFETAGG